MSRLPDPPSSIAILIGCSEYEDSQLSPIPAIRNNLRDLSSVLTELGEIDCIIIENPKSVIEVVDAINRAADEAGDLLILYYAGHGFVDNSGELFLGMFGTQIDQLELTAMHFDRIAGKLNQSRAPGKLVIIDSDFSGRSVGSLKVPGTYLITSTSRNSPALARLGDPYTAFSGELIRVLSQGIPIPDPALTIDDIFLMVNKNMRELGYPPPVLAAISIDAPIRLVRNRLFSPELKVGGPEESLEILPPATTEPSSASQGIEEPTNIDDDLDWSNDAPATLDLLHREPIAKVIALRLIETHVRQPEISFLMLFDGAWGSGKSSLLNLLEPRVSNYFRVVRFDAWQQSRLAPAWWSLLTSLRWQVTRGYRPLIRPWIRVRESGERIRRSGAPYLIAVLVVLTVALGAGYLLWPVHSALLKTWQEIARGSVAILTAAGILCAGALSASKVFLWDSVRGARLFEQNQSNPMADISRHFQWLLKRSKKPILFFIDDLDRCDQGYVVELLDAIQTLVRSGSNAQGGPDCAAYFVVAADGAWLRRSYETKHKEFVGDLNESGRSLGYLFLDKLFQLVLTMPSLGGSARSLYLDEILRVSEEIQARPERKNFEASNVPVNESDFAERMRLFEEGRAELVVAALANTTERRRAEHVLRKFAVIIGDNPRTVKKFLNTYSLLRSIRFLEDIDVDPNALGLWCVIVARWPSIAQHLSLVPESIAGITNPLWCSDHFPEHLRDVAKSDDLRTVVSSSSGGPLTADIIRRCNGISIVPEKAYPPSGGH